MTVDLSTALTITRVKRKLEPYALQEKCEILSHFIKKLDKEAEIAILKGEHDLAIWKMAHAVMLEDILCEYENELAAAASSKESVLL
jgi:phage shock protein A